VWRGVVGEMGWTGRGARNRTFSPALEAGARPIEPARRGRRSSRFPANGRARRSPRRPRTPESWGRSTEKCRGRAAGPRFVRRRVVMPAPGGNAPAQASCAATIARKGRSNAAKNAPRRVPARRARGRALRMVPRRSRRLGSFRMRYSLGRRRRERVGAGSAASSGFSRHDLLGSCDQVPVDDDQTSPVCGGGSSHDVDRAPKPGVEQDGGGPRRIRKCAPPAPADPFQWTADVKARRCEGKRLANPSGPDGKRRVREDAARGRPGSPVSRSSMLAAVANASRALLPTPAPHGLAVRRRRDPGIPR